MAWVATAFATVINEIMDSPEIRRQLWQTKKMIVFIDGIRQSEELEAQTNLIRGNKSRSHDKMRKVELDAMP
jgi:hypothetical protein